MRVHSPPGRALPAVESLIREQLERALACEALLRESCPVDAVHDYRVAQRRTRVLLQEYRDHLGAEAKELRRSLRWMARFTGPVRDLDLLIARIESRALRASARRRDGLESMTSTLLLERSAAAARLADRLDTARYAALVRSWRELSGDRADRTNDDSGSAFAAATGPRLRRRYERLVSAVRSLGHEPDDAAVHRARIEAKSVRYLLEFLESVRPSPDAAATTRALRSVQDRLGAFQDDVVHGAMLEEQVAAGAFPDPRWAVQEAAEIRRRVRRSRPVVMRALRRLDSPGFRARMERLAHRP